MIENNAATLIVKDTIFENNANAAIPPSNVSKPGFPREYVSRKQSFVTLAYRTTNCVHILTCILFFFGSYSFKNIDKSSPHNLEPVGSTGAHRELLHRK